MFQIRVQQRIQLDLAAWRLRDDQSIYDWSPDDVGAYQRAVGGDADIWAEVLVVEKRRQISIDERTHIS